MKKSRTTTAVTELPWVLAMSWVARDGSLAELRDAPVRGLAGYGHAVLAFVEYLRQEEPSLWQAVQDEIAVELAGNDEQRRAYYGRMARLLNAALLPDEVQSERSRRLAAEPLRKGETEGGGKRPTYRCQFCGSTEEDGRPCPKAAEVCHPLPRPASPSRPT
jgi:hypothetical protein